LVERPQYNYKHSMNQSPLIYGSYERMIPSYPGVELNCHIILACPGE